jgi:broad specificity phosphatase PhoE
VRHAEKASADKDTPLSERGRARARTLASMLANSGVTRLYATQYKRTQETLAPLSERIGVSIEVRPADKTADLLAELGKAPDGSVVVVATHSNVLPSIVRELGRGAKLRGVEGDSLADDDYSRVVVITSRCSAQGETPTPFVLELSSGEPSDSGKIAQ